MEREKNIALVGGGTAGHIMPNIALLPALKEHFGKIIYIGSPHSMEEQICKNENLPYYPTNTAKFHRRELWRNVTLPFALRKGIAEAKSILQRERISVVFSKGGYAAVPTVLAAKRLRIPVVCHESDRSLGLANRFTALFATKVFTAFPRTCKKGTVLSTPIRERIFRGEKMHLFRDESRPVILFMGGSLGAEAINDALSSSLADLTARYNVLHIAGKKATPIRAFSYIRVPFASDIENYFATADLVVSRAGASTLGELTALGKRVIAIPLPKGESRGDQVENAAYYLERGSVAVLPQGSLTTDNLLAAIDRNIKIGAPAPAYDRSTPRRLATALSEIAEGAPVY